MSKLFLGREMKTIGTPAWEQAHDDFVGPRARRVLLETVVCPRSCVVLK